jgi:hypothetical protein
MPQSGMRIEKRIVFRVKTEKILDRINRIYMIFFAFPDERQKVLSLCKGVNRNREGGHLINWGISFSISGIALSHFLPERVKTIIQKILLILSKIVKILGRFLKGAFLIPSVLLVVLILKRQF